MMQALIEHPDPTPNGALDRQPNWHHAMTLRERAAAHAAGGTVHSGDEERAGRWRSQPSFANGDFFVRRLESDGLSERDFMRLLEQEVYPCEVPAWLARLTDAFSQFGVNHSAPRSTESTGFLDVISPLIAHGRERVRQKVIALLRSFPEAPIDPDTIEDILYRNLPPELAPKLGRTMILEMNVARLRGELPGETGEERYQAFLRRLREPECALALLAEYPVLARQLVTAVDQWVDFSAQFIEDLCIDWSAIRETFHPDTSTGVLKDLNGGVGDKHRSGRSVLIAEFSSGFRVVYKPRSMAVDVHFQELLSWLNQHDQQPPFRTLGVIDRGSHGWVEFIAARSCQSEDEVQRFCERQGSYLTLLHALHAVDFHCENLIAMGEHPVFLDLETLFHPDIGGMHGQSADQIAGGSLASSVLRVGLLPVRIWGNPRSEGIDPSGFRSAPGQLTPEEVPVVEGTGTDEMRMARRRITLPASHNRPSLNGVDKDVLDYRESVIAGFSRTYRLIVSHRDALLADDGPLAQFRDDEVRVIVLPTRAYALLLQDSFHPDVLRDALDRDRLFDSLWDVALDCPDLVRLIPAQAADLCRNDIPFFATGPNSRDLLTSSNEIIADVLADSGMALARKRLSQLSEKDLEQQIWVINATFATFSTAPAPVRARLTAAETAPIASYESLLRAAQAVGDRLEESAFRGDGDASWIGMTLVNENSWAVCPLGPDLYSGAPGVALFLAYLGSVTGEERRMALARAALASTLKQVEINPRCLTGIGAFCGAGGAIYTLLHLSHLLHEPALLEKAEEIVESILPQIETDEQLDVIGGSAGLLGCLAAFYRYAPSVRTLDAAVRCGDRLLGCAKQMGQGVGWPTAMATQPLCGFSHGAAGIAWALLGLADLTHEPRFRATALDALAYERSLFSHVAGNWPDLRTEPGSQTPAENPQRFMSAWCHGAAGIGLARLASLPHLDDDATRAEIHAAVKATIAHGNGHSHSLCHGDLGNLELLQQAGEREHLERFAAVTLESIDQNGWICGNPLQVETPGLMTGLAGIGYGLLRLAEPKRVPSVLTLAPPTR
jgi:type 2 lantibiotic biosynthesis protein LanM